MSNFFQVHEGLSGSLVYVVSLFRCFFFFNFLLEQILITADVRQPWTDLHYCSFEYLIIRFDYLIIYIPFDYLIIG